MKKLAIWDLDGTVIDSTHRYKTAKCGTKIDLEYWTENTTPEKIMQDTLLPHHAQYKKDLNCPNTTVIIATARTMQKGDTNFKYIAEKVGQPDHIIHRDENEHTKGAELKTSKIIKMLKTVEHYDTITIYEDNMTYLQGMTEFFESMVKSVIPVFVFSHQGH